ncbi:MAG: PAAR domain-containing protein [Pseudomonadota bacterium]
MFSIIGSICVGDKTSCGGTVATGSPFSDVNGHPIARIGDRIACRNNCIIISGNQTEVIDGAPMALHGSQTSNGCTCLSKNNDLHGDGQTPAAAARIPKAMDPGIAVIPATAALLAEEHWVEFTLTDGDNAPIPHQPYVMTTPNGEQHQGTLDAQGHARVSPVKAGMCTVHFPDLGHSMSVQACQS